MNKEENLERIDHLKSIVLNMPGKPDSYQLYDRNHQIIYVGKAKNLKNRVSSYFRREVDCYKTKVLVSKVWDITYTVVNTEEDTPLLENSLIKEYNPRYSVLLKDGKTYPSIRVTKEYLPRIFKARRIDRRFGTYYSPYSQITIIYSLLELIKKLYKPRTCRFPITPEGISQGKYKPCLEYHIHNCKAPCVGKQTHENYHENITQAYEILKENTREVSKILYQQILKKAEELRSEEAEELKQKYEMLNNFVAKSEAVSNTIQDLDVFTFTDDGQKKNAFINYIHVKNGTINQSFTFEYKRELDETGKEPLITAIQEIRGRFKSKIKEIIIPFEINWSLNNATFFIPQRGDKKHLLDLSEMNGKQYKLDQLKRSERSNPEQKQTRLMRELQTKLKLPKLPYHTECFDNSNISGTDAVAGCIVFKGMKPLKKDYRKYDIKTVSGPDDYASMQEVVCRRYSRMTEEQAPLPDLIITDGGKGQMEVVREVLEDELHLQIPITGLAKNDHHRTNEPLLGFPPQVVGLKAGSGLFHLLTHTQDEVHRYAIAFHRDKRSKNALHSELDDIKSIGLKTKEQLLKALKSVERIKDSDSETLTEIIEEAKARTVFNHFHPNNP